MRSWVEACLAICVCSAVAVGQPVAETGTTVDSFSEETGTAVDFFSEDTNTTVELLGEEDMPLKDLRIPLEHYESGPVRTQLFAGAAMIPQSQKRKIKARRVRLETYDEDGTLNTVLTTDYCDFNRHYETLKARLPVRVERRDAVLTGDSLNWDMRSEKLKLIDNVKMCSSRTAWFGSGEEPEPMTGEWIPGVEGYLGTNCSTITADELVYNQYTNTIEFKGNVRGRSPEFALDSNEATVFLRENNTAERSVAEGNVRLVHGGRTATCENATYADDERTIVLEGDARVEAAEGTLHGSVITYWIDDERVECQQGTLTALPRPGEDGGDALDTLKGKGKGRPGSEG